MQPLEAKVPQVDLQTREPVSVSLVWAISNFMFVYSLEKACTVEVGVPISAVFFLVQMYIGRLLSSPKRTDLKLWYSAWVDQAREELGDGMIDGLHSSYRVALSKAALEGDAIPTVLNDRRVKVELDTVILESMDLNLRATGAYLALLLSTYGVEQSAVDNTVPVDASAATAGPSSPKGIVMCSNPFSTLQIEPRTPSETDSVETSTPPSKVKVHRQLHTLDNELETRKDTLLARHKKAETKAQETHDKTVKDSDKKLNTTITSAEAESKRRLKPLQKDLEKYQTEFDTLDSQLLAFQEQHEKARKTLHDQQSRIEVSHTTKTAQLGLARTAQEAAVESSLAQKTTSMAAAKQSHEQSVESAITANETKRDKLVKSLTTRDRDNILADEQERAENMAHMNPIGVDPEAALAMALQASSTSLENDTSDAAAWSAAFVAEAFEKLHPDESSSDISADLCVISVRTETIADSCRRCPIESDMGAAAFSAEETGKTDDTGVVEFKFEHGSNSLVITLSNKRVLRVIPDLTCADKGAPVRYEWIDTDKTEQQQARGISLCYAFAKHVHQDKARAASSYVNEMRKKPHNELKLTSQIEMKHFVRGLIGAIRMVSQMSPVDPEIAKVCAPHALGEKALRLLENFPVFFATCANVRFAPSMCVRELELFVDSLNATKVRGISAQPLVTDGQSHNIPIFTMTEDRGLFRCHVTAQVADLSKFVLSAIDQAHRKW